MVSLSSHELHAGTDANMQIINGHSANQALSERTSMSFIDRPNAAADNTSATALPKEGPEQSNKGIRLPLYLPLYGVGFANEGQFLLMNSASLADMNGRITTQASSSHKKKTAASQAKTAVGSLGDLARFRPNLLVGGAGVAAYAEDEWETVHIGNHKFFTAGKVKFVLCDVGRICPQGAFHSVFCDIWGECALVMHFSKQEQGRSVMLLL